MQSPVRRLFDSSGRTPRFSPRLRKTSNAGSSDSHRHRGRPRLKLSRASLIIWHVLAGASAPGRPRRLLRVWPKWEQLAHTLWPTIEIPHAPYGMLKLRLRRYKGGPVLLPDGSVVESNSTIAELHCMNAQFIQLAMGGASPYWACREDLRSLAGWIKSDPAAGKISALYGTTLLTVGARRLGFTAIEPQRSLRRLLDRFFMTGLLVLYTREGTARLAQGATLSEYPAEIWMTQKRLLEIYGDRLGRRPAARQSANVELRFGG